MEKHAVVVSEQDFGRLSAMLAKLSPEQAALLEEELAGATVVPQQQLPADIVAMGSRASFRDLDTGAEFTVTLVYPGDASVDAHRVSVLAPVGAALIGLKVGQSIEWPVPRGAQRRLQVVAVEQDPAFAKAADE